MQSSSSPQGQHSYILDPESAAEMGRLLLQDRLLNDAMGGLLSEYDDISHLHHILDVACGPGGWALSMAQQYPDKQITGIDISELMVAYGNTQVKREQLSNIQFNVANILEPLPFKDASFDLINLRALFGAIPRIKWPQVLQECMRVLRPNGIVRLTEFDLPGFTNSESLQAFNSLGARLFQRIGYGFSPDGSSFGMTHMLKKLLLDAGCQQVQLRPYVIDFSYGSQLYTSQTQNILTVFKQGQVPLVKMGMATQEELNLIYNRMEHDMQGESFLGVQYWLTAWGIKTSEV